jgi:uncharacterized protein YjbJ (UPF0337 family)
MEGRQEIAMAQAEADYEVAQERCRTLDGEARDQCMAQAEARYEAARSNAERLAADDYDR